MSIKPGRNVLRHCSWLNVVGAVALALAFAGDAASLHAQSAAAIDPTLFQDLEYRSLGPTRGGRVTAVWGVPDQPSLFYMGSTGGGVWKTTDYGQSWVNISDGYFDTGSIGAIRVAASNPEVIYVGTGSDGLRSNIIVGKGVYKSTDAGESWTHVGLENVGQIGRMAIHPTNPDIVWAAAIGGPFGESPDRGVYKTTDGGSTWDKVLFISDSVGVYGLVLEPGNPDVVYAGAWRAERRPWTIISGAHASAGTGIYKSTDGGESWTRLTEGLPDGLIGKIDLSISPANPERVYALIEAPEPLEGLYRSDDAGRTWQLMNGEDGLLDRPFYYTNVQADPADADVVYVNNEGFFKSTDGGATLERLSTPHGDNHDMWINPNDPDVFIQANDGGVNVTRDGGQTWSTQYNQPTAELYQVDLNDAFPYWACAGQQDNTTICVPNLPPGGHVASGQAGWWRAVSGCETGPAVPKPGDPDIVYGNCKGRFSVYNFRTGQEQNYWVGGYYMYGHATRDLPWRFQRVSPIEVSPHDPDVVYHGSQYVHRTADGGVTWETISPDLTAQPEGTQGISGEPITRDITGEEFYSTLYAIEVSPHDPDVIWVGSNDGPFHVTRDGGETWTDVTPDDLAPGGRVQNIEPSPHEPGKAYFAVYRYLLDDWHPYIYRTTDYGQSWTLLTDGQNGIPVDWPTRVVREDPERPGLLYAGTSFGMFVSFDDGARWQPFQLNLPVTPVTDIELFRGDLVLSTMGRGFWVIDDLAPLRQLTPAVASASAHLFDPAAAYRMRYRGSGGSGGPEYPDPGARIDYFFADAPAGELSLEIFDEQGELVRAFSSEAAGERLVEPEEPGMRAPSLERVGTPRLPTGPGMHRFVWDLRHAGAWDEDPEDSGQDGPLAVPGTYEIRLTAGDWTQTRTLEVRMDPRVEAAGVTEADLAEQLAFNLRLRDAISQARLAAARIDAAQARLDQAGGEDEQAVRGTLAEIEAQLVTDESAQGYPRPMLLDQLDYLSGMTTNADQKLGGDAFERLEVLRAELDQHIARLRELDLQVVAF